MWLAIKTSPAPVTRVTLTIGGVKDIKLFFSETVTGCSPSVTTALLTPIFVKACAANFEVLWF